MKKIDLIKRLRFIGKRIYKHGEDAAKKGMMIDDNPWNGTLHEYYIWRNGFINQKK